MFFVEFSLKNRLKFRCKKNLTSKNTNIIKGEIVLYVKNIHKVRQVMSQVNVRENEYAEKIL